ncbi:MAG: NUDIX domain-containing protein [gamma proteobacterium symbiont of Bathyaustriella thionipta]|nr:NUDIX domain-containing protein [gamma proteobacterium symbiont of Bathyaustriella thionipta]
MLELIPGIRNTARALIIHQEKILLLRKAGGERGERYALPGGAQETGETLEEALQRECLEEIATRVNIHGLRHVSDFFKIKDTQPPSRRHLLEFLFRCSVSDDYIPRNGHHPDKHQVEVLWVELQQARQLPLYPQYLTSCIEADDTQHKTIYLGSFHDSATA